jgi:hypothetical protein
LWWIVVEKVTLSPPPVLAITLEHFHDVWRYPEFAR